MAGERVWKRIEIEFSAGATAEWLSVKYGPAVRTIGARAKAGGWRKKDIALKADAAWDEVEDEERLAEETRAAVRAASDTAAAGRAAVKAAIREAGEAEAEAVDLERAAAAARAGAVAAMEKGDPRLAQEFLKLARMLEGEGDGEGYAGPSPQDAAALAYVLERLEARG
ncbi:hypothetical protein [Brevundimonas sp.]|uniref:hypothetical protein n=1 Tax=Brevundimonas sp. TaxID=1871086 RepID=UPI002629E68B|nr:hypothetical protein [Brevundimonas sp.]